MDDKKGAASTEISQLSTFLARSVDECELCHRPGGEILWENGLCRVVAVADEDYPGFCRVILSRHVREMSDLDTSEREGLMKVVFAVEACLRHLYQPDKINLASLGNVVPHVHWHIIPRWHDDRHFPQPIWSTPQRATNCTRQWLPLRALTSDLCRRLGAGKSPAME